MLNLSQSRKHHERYGKEDLAGAWETRTIGSGLRGHSDNQIRPFKPDNRPETTKEYAGWETVMTVTPSVLKSGLVWFFCLFWHQPDCDQLFSVSKNGRTMTGPILTGVQGCPTQPDHSCDQFFAKTRYVFIFTTNSYPLICCVFQIAQVHYSFTHMHV